MGPPTSFQLPGSFPAEQGDDRPQNIQEQTVQMKLEDINEKAEAKDPRQVRAGCSCDLKQGKCLHELDSENQLIDAKMQTTILQSWLDLRESQIEQLNEELRTANEQLEKERRKASLWANESDNQQLKEEISRLTENSRKTRAVINSALHELCDSNEKRSMTDLQEMKCDAEQRKLLKEKLDLNGGVYETKDYDLRDHLLMRAAQRETTFETMLTVARWAASLEDQLHKVK